MGITSPLVKLLAAVASILVLAAIIFPVFAGSYRGGPRTLCLSNVKQITLAHMMYSVDHNDRFASAPVWEDATYPYLKRALACPEAPGKRYGYAMRDELSGVKLQAVSSPAATPLIIESVACIPNAHGDENLAPKPGRHRGRNNAGYADGHAKSVSVPQ